MVDDDRKAVSTIALYLEHDGHTVLEAYSGTGALECVRRDAPDLIILDLMLPGIDGFDIARLLRLDSDVPIIMLTARTFEEDRIAGFEAGADDYVTKPFSPRELVARVNAVLRRSHGAEREAAIRVGRITVDPGAHEVYVGKVRVQLTRTEFRVLETLAREPDRVFGRSQIVERVFGSGYAGLDRSVDTHLSNLRRKLDDAGAGDAIETVHGVGYRLRAGSGAR